MDGPDSSYSALEIHIVWKVDNDAKIEPPIQTEYLRSGGAMILILMVDGAKAVISFCIRSAIPGKFSSNRSQSMHLFFFLIENDKIDVNQYFTWEHG